MSLFPTPQHRITMKGLIHHVPTDDDISNILKEFTVDFLLKGYGFLVHELHAQLLSDLVSVRKQRTLPEQCCFNPTYVLAGAN